MLHIVKSPGSCGELVQGAIGDQHFLVTCPINRYSYALSSKNMESLWPLIISTDIEPLHFIKQMFNVPSEKRAMADETKDLGAIEKEFLKTIQMKGTLQDKGQQMVKLLHHNAKEVDKIVCFSQLPPGKGLASSSADLSAIAMATSLLQGLPMSYKDIAQACLQIEPTDASFYPGIVQFDYKKGAVTNHMGHMPPMKFLIFDTGGMIDTIAFNAQANLDCKIKEKEAVIKEALRLLAEGLHLSDPWRIGQAATMSAKANQHILYKPELDACIKLAKELHCYGIITAHSGTIIAFMCAPDYEEHKAKDLVLKKCPTLAYFDTVNTTNEGITYDTIDTARLLNIDL